MTALAVLLVGGGAAAGASVASSQSDERPAPVVAETTTTTERTATRVRPTTATTRPLRCTDIATQEQCDTALAPASPPPVVVREAPPAVTYDTGPTCDAACTADIMDGYSNDSDESGFQVEPPPCQPSTFHACDPAEPMDLPVFGCDVLETTFSGDVRCVG